MVSIVQWSFITSTGWWQTMLLWMPWTCTLTVIESSKRLKGPYLLLRPGCDVGRVTDLQSATDVLKSFHIYRPWYFRPRLSQSCLFPLPTSTGDQVKYSTRARCCAGTDFCNSPFLLDCLISCPFQSFKYKCSGLAKVLYISYKNSLQHIQFQTLLVKSGNPLKFRLIPVRPWTGVDLICQYHYDDVNWYCFSFCRYFRMFTLCWRF